MYSQCLPAYRCVLGSFAGCMLSLGFINSLAVLQSHISTHQLPHVPASSTGWIFGLYTFLSFFCGILAGPIFDARDPRELVAVGSGLMVLTWVLLGFCEAYWHFVLGFAVVGGVGSSASFTASVAAVSHWFREERGRWTGLAAVGGSVSGIVNPLVLEALVPRVGWAWATRVLGLVGVVLAVVAVLCIRGRLPKKVATKKSLLPDAGIFRDRTFALVVAGVFFMDWGLFVPLGYISSYALSIGVDQKSSFELVAVLNAGSCVGRYLPGYLADVIGRFNTMILAISIYIASVFALWLPAQYEHGLVIAFAAVFGFSSGSNISLVPVCVGQLCKTENFGRYYATCCTAMSFATLTGFPIAGALVQAWGGDYTGLVIFTGTSYAVSLALFVAARLSRTGWVAFVKF